MNKLNISIRKLLASIRRRYIALTSEYICVTKTRGLLWASSSQDKRISYYYKYCAGRVHQEEEQLAKLLRLCEKLHPTVFIDIGANYGWYSLMLSQKLPALSHIIAFEPADDMMRYFRMNILLNKLEKRIHTYATALSNETREGVLLIDPSSAGIDTLPHTEQGQSDHFSSAAKQQVKIDTLDNATNLRNETLLIKIDVEGAELAVLEGAKDTLRNNNCLIQIEVFNNNRKLIENLLSGLNYKFIDEIKSESKKRADGRADMWYCSSSLEING